MKVKRVVLLLAMAASLFSVSAENDVSKLLEGYLENDLTIQKLSSKVKSAQLSSQSADVSNGISVCLETGTMTYVGGTTNKIKISPDLSVEIPEWDNLKLSLSSDVAIVDGTASASDSSISLSADVFGSTMETRNIALLKAQREVLVAKRNLYNRFISAEEEFYTQLKSLYTTAASIVSKESDLYDDQISFNEVIASGYSKSSTKYRLAEMEVISDQHNIETLRRELERETKIFASKCGITYEGEDAFEFLPESIPQVEAVDAKSFDADSYADTESAIWTNYINSLTRKADKDVNIGLSCGYTFANEDTDSDTVDVGSTLKLSDTGLVVSGGVSIPTDSSSPCYSIGLSVDPSAFIQSGITKQQYELSEEQEKIDIESSRNDYETDMIDCATTLADIKWNKETNLSSYEMYKSLADDTEKYFKSGIITESEWREAVANRENYRIQLLINDIELIIYNADTKLLFCHDEELNK